MSVIALTTMLRGRMEIPAVTREPLRPELADELLGTVFEFDEFDPVPATITYAHVASDGWRVFIAFEYQR